MPEINIRLVFGNLCVLAALLVLSGVIISYLKFQANNIEIDYLKTITELQGKYIADKLLAADINTDGVWRWKIFIGLSIIFITTLVLWIYRNNIHVIPVIPVPADNWPADEAAHNEDTHLADVTQLDLPIIPEEPGDSWTESLSDDPLPARKQSFINGKTSYLVQF